MASTNKFLMRKHLLTRLLPGLACILFAGCDSDVESPHIKASSKTSQKPKTSKSDAPKPRVIQPAKLPLKKTWNRDGVDDFELIESSGRTITKADLLGKPWVVCFIFTRCAGTCPKVTYEMYNLQEWLKSQKMDVMLVSLSVDPVHDTPLVLKNYAENHVADPKRWWFLTGQQQKIYSLINKSFRQLVGESKGANRTPGFEVFHTSAMLLVDEKGRVLDGYNGQYKKTIADLHKRLREWKKTGSFPEPPSSKPANKTAKPVEKKTPLKKAEQVNGA